MLMPKKRPCPVDYRLCNQTVTVYHKDEDTYSRTVFKNAFLDHKKTQSVDKTGSKEANSFLLVIPGDSQSVFVGDKIFEGIGPKIEDRAAWASFIPANVSGLVVANYADPKKWDGKIVHTEAGG